MLKWLSGDVDDSGTKLLKNATDDMILGTDWVAVMNVCDFANHDGPNGRQVIVAIQNRLANRSSAVIGHVLTVIEALGKNGNETVLRLIGRTEHFMREVASIATGSTPNQQQALRVIQELGQKFQAQRDVYPGFYNNYARLTQQGVIFPVQNDRVPPVAPSSSEESFENKIMDDLSVLQCKLDVADHVSGIEERLDVLDFLLQCKPRMVDLIEASAQGVLDDTQLLERLLEINDRLYKTVIKLEQRDDTIQLDEGEEEIIVVKRQEVVKRVIPKLRAAPIAKSIAATQLPVHSINNPSRKDSKSKSSKSTAVKNEENETEEDAPLIRRRKNAPSEEEESLLF